MLYKRLKQLREMNHKSQQEVCAELNIEQSTLANYENGKRTPRIEILIKLAEYFHCTTDYLLGISDEIDEQKSTSNLPDDSRKFIDLFSELNEENKDIIIGDMRKYIKEQHMEQLTEEAIKKAT